MPKRKPKGLTGPGGVPVVKHEPSYSFNEAIQLWFGAPKTGKTSTAAAMGVVAEEYGIEDEVNPFFILCEKGSGGVTLNCTSEKCSCEGKDEECEDCHGTGSRRKVLGSIEELKEWCTWAGGSPFSPIVIDTCDGLYQIISDGICAGLGINNPSEAEYGTAWFQIFNMVREVLGILVASGKGLILLMHVTMQEVRLKGGATISKATFNVSGKSRGYIGALANQILYFDVVPDGERDKHIITCAPTAGIEAGDHWGILPEEIDRGESPEEGAKAILSCFEYEFKD